MSSKIEIKKIEVEILRVQAATSEMELKIEERLEEIDRIKSHIVVQQTKLVELNQKLQELKTITE